MDDEAETRRRDQPHLWNLNEDPALTDIIVHFIDKGDNTVGTCFGGSIAATHL